MRTQIFRQRGAWGQGQIHRPATSRHSGAKGPRGKLFLVLFIEGATEFGLGDFMVPVVFEFNAISVGLWEVFDGGGGAMEDTPDSFAEGHFSSCSIQRGNEPGNEDV